MNNFEKYEKILNNSNLSDAIKIYNCLMNDFTMKCNITKQSINPQTAILKYIKNGKYQEYLIESNTNSVFDDVIHYNKKQIIRRSQLSDNNIKCLFFKYEYTGDIIQSYELNVFTMDYEIDKHDINGVVVPCYIAIGDEYLLQKIFKDYSIIQKILTKSQNIYVIMHTSFYNLFINHKIYFDVLSVNTNLEKEEFLLDIISFNNNKQNVDIDTLKTVSKQFSLKFRNKLQCDNLFMLIYHPFININVGEFIKDYFIQKFYYYLKNINNIYKSTPINIEDIEGSYTPHSILLEYQGISLSIKVNTDIDNNLLFDIRKKDKIDPVLLEYISLYFKSMSDEDILFVTDYIKNN